MSDLPTSDPAETRVHRQEARGASPWSLGRRLALVGWSVAWALLCRWTPKPLYPWRNAVLRLFGAKVGRGVFVHQSARINQPWNLQLEDGASIGECATLYALGPIRVGKRAVVAQEAYLCTGTHDFESEKFELVTKPVHVGDDAFVGARAFVLPGVTIGERAIVGAMAVVTKDVERCSIVAGNPARRVG